MRHRLPSLCLGLIAGLHLTAAAATPPKDIARQRQAFAAAVRESIKLFQEQKYRAAIDKLHEADALVPNQPTVHYNLACARALTGKKQEALDALEKSVRLGFANPLHMQADKDLESVRQTKRFGRLVELAKKNARVPPPLTHVPQAYKEKGTNRYPLFVALHGRGGRPDNFFRAAKQILGPNDFFVLAPYGSAKIGPGYTWSGADFTRIPAAITELKKKYRIGKVYLFGHSAGAHLGYALVFQSRELFDGFIPMAGALRRQYRADPGLKKVKGLPVYAIQGANDRVVPLLAAQASLGAFKKHGAVTKMFTHPGGHAGPRNFRKALVDATKWLDENQPKK